MLLEKRFCRVVRLENASFAVAAMVSDVPVLQIYVYGAASERARFHPIRAIQFKIIAPAAPPRQLGSWAQRVAHI